MRTAAGSAIVEPELWLSALRYGVAAVAAVTLAAAALSAWLDLGPDYLSRVTILAILGLLALSPLVPRHAPLRKLGPGNAVTMIRGGLIALLAGFITEPLTPLLCWLLVVVATGTALLDIVDGRLARRAGMTSAFGARFDLETDAVMIAVLAFLAWQLDKAGSWILLAGALRYGFVVAGVLQPWLARPLPPSRRRQTLCVVQIVALITLLVPIILPPLSIAIAAISIALLCYSFGVDVRWLAHRRDHPSIEGGVT